MQNSLNRIRRFRLSHIIAILTILGSGCAIILSLLKIMELTRAEEIIITLLGLIAIDALIERLHILEKIESKLDKEQYKPILRRRVEILPPDKLAKNASSIYVLAISAYSIISGKYPDFYKSKLKEGCYIKFILLSPDSKYFDSLDQQILSDIETKDHINSSLRILKPLSELKNYKGKLEIRLLDMFFPFSMIGIDFGEKTGKICVEYHCYKVSLEKRPHIILESEKDPDWFNFYQSQFDLAWSDAKKV